MSIGEDLPRRPAARRRPARTAGLAIAAILLLAVIGFAAYKVSSMVGAQRVAASPAAAPG